VGDEEECLVSRNQEMFDAMEYLRNRLPDTDILQEYFVPQPRMPEFIDGLRNTVLANGANLVNVTIRIVTRDTVTALPYAREDMFAFVLYFNQGFNEKESAILQKTTTDLIDVVTGLGGTFYLAYQLYYSSDQLRRAYPQIDAFFEAKRRLDPIGLFTNKFYEKYGRQQHP
jgi:FAD/FMN-containing dehydrogenase